MNNIELNERIIEQKEREIDSLNNLIKEAQARFDAEQARLQDRIKEAKKEMEQAMRELSK